jgi:hypothetical protein
VPQVESHHPERFEKSPPLKPRASHESPNNCCKNAFFGPNLIELLHPTDLHLLAGDGPQTHSSDATPEIDELPSPRQARVLVANQQAVGIQGTLHTLWRLLA